MQIVCNSRFRQAETRAARIRRASPAGLIAVVVWIAVVFPGTVALAQATTPAAPGVEEPADPKPGAETAQAIPMEKVPGRAEATSVELDALLPENESRQALERIGAELNRTLPEIQSLLAKTTEALAARPSVRILQELEAELIELRKRVRQWDEELDRQLARAQAALQQLDTTAAAWEAAAKIARREGADAPTVKRIAAVLAELETTRSTLAKWRDRIVAVRDRLVDPSNALGDSIQQVQNTTEARLQGIFRIDQPPLWSPQLRASLRAEWQAGGPRQLLEGLREGGRYARSQWRMFGVQLALLIALLLGLCRLRVHARARADEDDYNLSQAKEAFEQPWAMALLIAVMLSASLHPLAPRSTNFVAGLLLALAVLAIVRRFMTPTAVHLAWGLTLFFVVDRVRDLLETTPALERIVFMVEMAAALALLLWLLRPSRIAKIPAQQHQAPLHPLLGTAIRVGAAVLALALVADLVGWGDLASLLGNGALRSGYLGLFVFVLLVVVQSLATFALVLWPLRLLRAVSRHQLLIRHRLERVLSVLAVGVWSALVFAQLGLLSTALDGASRLLGAGVTVGTLSVSVGGMLVFVLTVWLSFLLARWVNFVLQEDVFTRVHTARGVPYAISGLVRYTLILLGVLFGLAAAGVELSKLAVIAGGLGVGIGFGLQNVVNNFVSGLILLFERPLQIGDSVQVSDTWGTMKHIGIRASVIRTFDGAEVIVPNGMLISEKVTNWTLSDRSRRIEVGVGVEYGTPAQTVIDLLVGVAKANPKVIHDPEPYAYFINFGDSSLDFKLRVWVEFDDGYSASSELAVAIQAALDQAGIGVPFPQRDLHVVSVTPEAASDLGTAPRPSPQPGPSSDSGDGH